MITKPISPSTAVALIRPGAQVYVAAKGGTPITLLEELLRQGTPDVELFYFLIDGMDPAEMVARAPMIKHRPLYVGTPLARSQIGDAVSYVPLSLPDAAAMVESGRLTFDAALIATTLPDAGGRVSLGTAVGMTPGVLNRVPLIIAEQLSTMPFTFGETTWPVETFSAIVESDRPLAEFRHERDDDRSERIGRYISRLIEDGATLQVGPGRVPNGALRFLSEHHGLRILTDLLSEELSDLVESGAVNCGKQDGDPGVMASFCTGTAALFERVRDDPRYTFWPIENVTDRQRLAKRSRMVSITQAFAIDLTGQACCDRIGDTLFGGLGSQPEFMRAASRSAAGKAILCLYSTDEEGRSNVCSALRAGEAVAIPRSDVHFVITEWGIASLHGKSIEQRALSLIEIAHPEHRPMLLDEARSTGLISSGYRQLSRDAYHIEDERSVVTRSGKPVLLRPASLSDVPELQRLFHHFTSDDIYLRFFRYLRALSVEEAVRLCTGDQALDAFFVAVVDNHESGRIVASAQYFGEPTSRLAEVGYLVDPEWQGLGIGRHLQTLLIEKARAMGFRGLIAEVLTKNRNMIQLAKSSGLNVSSECNSKTCEFILTW